MAGRAFPKSSPNHACPKEVLKVPPVFRVGWGGDYHLFYDVCALCRRRCCMVGVACRPAHMFALSDRMNFARAGRQHRVKDAANGFSPWGQFMMMLFYQVGGAHSLIERGGGLATALGKLVHWIVRRTSISSTLAHTNAHHPRKS